MTSLLSIRDLAVAFRQGDCVTTAIHSLSFSVQAGETLAIVGESGSGKSVSALSILQLLPVPPAIYRSGQILFSGRGQTERDLLQLPEKELKKLRGKEIAMIFQEPMTSLNPLFTCGNQVMEAIKLHQPVTDAEAKRKTIALFDKVRLPDPTNMFSRYPHEISGGQKQRVMIAMAISCEPSLLIADEPTTALDVTVQRSILRLIQSIRDEKNMGVIFISHDLGLVSEIADRVIVMYQGKIVETNTTSALFKHPRHPYTKALLACRPVLHPKGERLPVVSDFLDLPAADSKGNSTISVIEHFYTEKNETVAGIESLFDSTRELNRLTREEKPEHGPLLRVSELKVWFPKKKKGLRHSPDFIKAVDGVSFDIKEGQTVGLVGESGCGKTTLGRSIIRLIEPVSGSVFFEGENILEWNRKRLRQMRRKFQIVFQDPYSSLNPRTAIGKAIQEVMRLHDLGVNDRDRKERVIHLLEKVNMAPDHYFRYPHEFSGGQRQRIGIARALALEPSFMIYDESVSALDVSVQAQVLNLLNDLKKDFGFAALFISHDLSVVHYISDTILVMQQGRIVESGKSEDVYTNPQNDYTKKLIAAIPGKRFSA